MKNLRKDINIFVVGYKDYPFPIKNQDIYFPLWVGNNRSQFVGLYDNQYEDNIADKNKNFSELTGLYAAWKHCNADIIGLVHYRRYFINKPYIENCDLYYPIVNKLDLDYIFEHYDIIIPTPLNLEIQGHKVTVKQQYYYYHNGQDWEITRQILQDIFPEYVASFDYVGENTNLYINNIFIAKRAIALAYCEWLFPILFEIERRIDTTYYGKYQERLQGFLAERLFTTWIFHNQKQYKFLEMKVSRIENGEYDGIYIQGENE